MSDLIVVEKPPVVGVTYNPLMGMKYDDMVFAHVGALLKDVQPDAKGGLLTCRLNGGPEYVSMQDWGDYRLRKGDIIEWIIYPQNRMLLTAVLMIALVFVAPYLVPYIAPGVVAGSFTATVIAAGIVMVGGIAIQALLGAPSSSSLAGTQSAASPTYNTSLSGNSARLFDVIPKICGRHYVTPPFAAQPYLRYDDLGDQYYYALLAVGVGVHSIESELIDKTNIRHFADIIAHRYLPAGVLPHSVSANIVTAPEVAAQEMKSGVYIGGFTVCNPKLKVVAVEIDVVASQGLGAARDDGSFGPKNVTWRVESRMVDDYGRPIGAWYPLATEMRTGSTNTPQRWTNSYVTPLVSRFEVRIVRVDVQDTNNRVLNTLVWAGLRGVLSAYASLNPNVAHYEVVMRASEQLSSLSQRQIGLIVQGFVRTWTPLAGWGPEIPSRNPAWWIVELATSPVWGLGFPDERVDLVTFYELSQVWDIRQDRFDFVFDTSLDAWEAMQKIARAGRARVFRRAGILSIARDALADIPVTAFTSRNCIPGTMQVTEALATVNTPDGLIIEYFDNVAWAWLPMQFPLPDVTVITNPTRQRLEGITGPTHAIREALYTAASMQYRPRLVECTTEMQGMLPAYMSPVLWQPEIGSGQTGDVTNWELSSLTMGLSEKVMLTGADYITLMRDDGTLTDPISVTAGSTPNEVQLAIGFDFAPILDDPNRERPKYILGTMGGSSEIVKISGITDGGLNSEGAQLYKLMAVVDDPRVHAADNAYLPGPGDLQDIPAVAIDTIDTSNLAVLSNQTITGNDSVSITFSNDGRLRWATGGTSGTTGVFATQWLYAIPAETSEAALFELTWRLPYGSYLSPFLFTSPPQNTWLNLGSSITWSLVGTDTDYSTQNIQVDIRQVGETIIQASAIITLDLQYVTIPEWINGGGSSGD